MSGHLWKGLTGSLFSSQNRYCRTGSGALPSTCAQMIVFSLLAKRQSKRHNIVFSRSGNKNKEIVDFYVAF